MVGTERDKKRKIIQEVGSSDEGEKTDASTKPQKKKKKQTSEAMGNKRRQQAVLCEKELT